MRQATTLDHLRFGFDSLSLSIERAAEAFRKMGRALILIDAPVEAGDWPDCFTLVNRYVRTGLIPRSLNGGRWEA